MENPSFRFTAALHKLVTAKLRNYLLTIIFDDNIVAVFIIIIINARIMISKISNRSVIVIIIISGLSLFQT